MTLPGLRSRVDDAAAMRGVDRCRDLCADARYFVDGESTLAKAILEGLALQVLHDQILGPVLGADIEQHAHIRVLELRDGPRLSLEPLAVVLVLAQLGSEHLGVAPFRWTPS